ncbi:hypothetical protein BKA70DRAFT_465770 [Coprinopsis sp. MPI-PUGE-AT-0042]|nr:hypothetical protein BKA70DRAFT_465770 [Coprinopsis sp. MPI-PUGE-AT-0042]
MNSVDAQPETMVDSYDVCSSRLADVRQQILDLEEKLEFLKDEETELVSLLLECNNERSPVGRLTDDVLREIFFHCLPPLIDATFSPHRAPILLSHVCSRWRAISHDFSALWSTLRVTITPSQTKMKSAQCSSLANAWLLRCKKTKVQLRLMSYIPDRPWDRFNPSRGPNRDDIPDEASTMFLANVLTHLPSFNLNSLVLANIPAELLQGFQASSFFCLQKLGIHYDSPFNHLTPGDGYLTHIETFAQCSSLQKVAISGEFFHQLARAIALPWKRLSHLFYDCRPHPSIFSQDLSRMDGLQTLCIGIGEETTGSWDPWKTTVARSTSSDTPTVMNHLTSLTLLYSHSSDIYISSPDFLFAYEFPSLRNLAFEGGFWDFEETGWPGTTRNTFLAKLQSSSHLTRLSISLNEIERETCKALFKCIPQLTVLDLELCDRYDTILELLTLIPGRALLPALKTLVLDVGNEGQYEILADDGHGDDKVVNAGRLSDMVASRLPPDCDIDSRLERVVFYATDAWQLAEDRPFLLCLNQFVDQGLCVEHRYVAKHARDFKSGNYWMERDEQMDDWDEANLIVHGYNARDLEQESRSSSVE